MYAPNLFGVPKSKLLCANIRLTTSAIHNLECVLCCGSVKSLVRRVLDARLCKQTKRNIRWFTWLVMEIET